MLASSHVYKYWYWGENWCYTSFFYTSFRDLFCVNTQIVMYLKVQKIGRTNKFWSKSISVLSKNYFFIVLFVCFMKSKNLGTLVLSIIKKWLSIYKNKSNFQYIHYKYSRLRSNLSIVACFSNVDCFFYWTILIKKCPPLWTVARLITPNSQPH